MITVDTNVLLRYLLQDDETQSAKATKLFESQVKILITDVVLVETIWTLRGKKYQLSKEKIIDVIHALFSEPVVTFEDGEAVWCALKDYTHAESIKVRGKIKWADFPGALIVNKAKRYGVVNDVDVSPVVTFDQLP